MGSSRGVGEKRARCRASEAHDGSCVDEASGVLLVKREAVMAWGEDGLSWWFAGEEVVDSACQW